MVIYCDMDGVLTDYNTSFREVFNDAPNNVFSLLGEETVNSILNDVEGYWRDMPWTEDGKTLWFFIKSYNPVLLTTPALSVKDCKQDKISWKNKELGSDVNIIFSSTKYDYASPDSILIDDKKENIDAFTNNGGIGILHTSAEETITQLIPILNELLQEKIVAKSKYFTIKETAGGREYNDSTRKAAVCLPIRISNDNIEVLIRKEHNDVRGSFYTLVGGGVEPNESKEQGVIRELKEEAGITATQEDLYYAGQLVNDKYTKNKVDLFLILIQDSNKQVPETDGTLTEKIAVNMWVDMKELESLLISLDDSFLLAALFKFYFALNELGK